MENTQNENKPEEKSKFLKLKRETCELIRFIIFAGLIIIPFRIFIAQPFIVNGASMDPTFETGQYLIVDQLTYRSQEPERGDVIIFRFPLNPKDFYIKRVIGLPNETVTIKGSDVYIQEEGEATGYKLNEPYLEHMANNNISVTLKPDEYFVMGDNRPNSSDSRHWGVLPKEFIVGRAYIRLLPFDSIDFLPGEYHQNLSTDSL
jgi:signal peptidase I